MTISRLRQKIANLFQVPGAMRPEPLPSLVARSQTMFPLRRNEPARAIDRLRGALKNRYGARAPEFTARMLGALDAAEQLDPRIAKALREIHLDPQNAAFSPQRGAIWVDNSNPATFLHEFGHARDNVHKPEGFLGQMDPRRKIRPEASATRQAYEQLGYVDPELSALNGTYWERVQRSDAVQRHRPSHEVGALMDPVMLRLSRNKSRAGDARIRAQALRDIHDHPTGLPSEIVPRQPYTPEQEALITRLEAAAIARFERAQRHVDVLRNALAAPHLHPNIPPPRPHTGTRLGLNEHVGPGAGEAAYEYEAYLHRLNSAQEHPRVTAARNFFGIPEYPMAASTGPILPPERRPYVPPQQEAPEVWNPLGHPVG